MQSPVSTAGVLAEMPATPEQRAAFDREAEALAREVLAELDVEWSALEPGEAAARAAGARRHVEYAAEAARQAAGHVDEAEAIGVRARMRLVEHRASRLMPSQFEALARLLGEDLAAADAAAKACRAAAAKGDRAWLAALSAVDGKTNNESEGA